MASIHHKDYDLDKNGRARLAEFNTKLSDTLKGAVDPKTGEIQYANVASALNKDFGNVGRLVASQIAQETGSKSLDARNLKQVAEKWDVTKSHAQTQADYFFKGYNIKHGEYGIVHGNAAVIPSDFKKTSELDKLSATLSDRIYFEIANYAAAAPYYDAKTKTVTDNDAYENDLMRFYFKGVSATEFDMGVKQKTTGTAAGLLQDLQFTDFNTQQVNEKAFVKNFVETLSSNVKAEKGTIEYYDEIAALLPQLSGAGAQAAEYINKTYGANDGILKGRELRELTFAANRVDVLQITRMEQDSGDLVSDFRNRSIFYPKFIAANGKEINMDHPTSSNHDYVMTTEPVTKKKIGFDSVLGSILFCEIRDFAAAAQNFDKETNFLDLLPYTGTKRRLKQDGLDKTEYETGFSQTLLNKSEQPQ